MITPYPGPGIKKKSKSWHTLILILEREKKCVLMTKT